VTRLAEVCFRYNPSFLHPFWISASVFPKTSTHQICHMTNSGHVSSKKIVSIPELQV
jgi:hypothetical protein